MDYSRRWTAKESVLVLSSAVRYGSYAVKNRLQELESRNSTLFPLAAGKSPNIARTFNQIMLFLGTLYGGATSVSGVVGVSYLRILQESVTYVNRVLAFMFATDESFEKLMALPKATRKDGRWSRYIQIATVLFFPNQELETPLDCVIGGVGSIVSQFLWNYSNLYQDCLIQRCHRTTSRLIACL